MTTVVPISTLIQKLVDRGMKQDEIGSQLDLSQASVSRMLKGSQNPDFETYVRIYTFVEGVPPEPLAEPAAESVIGVYGYIGAGGSIDTSTAQIDQHEPLFEVKVPFAIPDSALAFQVRGESMWPKYDPDDIVLCSRFVEHPDLVLGRIAAVETETGERYLKRILKGNKLGLYHLLSYNAPELMDVHVVSFGEVIASIPASKIKTIAYHDRRNVIRQIKT